MTTFIEGKEGSVPNLFCPLWVRPQQTSLRQVFSRNSAGSPAFGLFEPRALILKSDKSVFQVNNTYKRLDSGSGAPPE
jgi:hypothetical protein